MWYYVVNKLMFYAIITQILIFLSLTSLFGGIVYRAYSLNNIGIVISLILAIISFLIIQRFKVKNNRQQTAEKSPPDKEGWGVLNFGELAKTQKIINLLLITIYLLLITVSFYILISNQTANSIISPWQVVPNYFFIIYALATAILIFIIEKFPKPYALIPNILILVHYFLSFSIALIIYKIGYGYDPFIHQATEELIDKTGAVLPKQFYYLGQYALIAIFHKITFIPIVWLDKFLVPLLSAIYIPLAFWHALKKIFSDHKTIMLLILALLAFPFSFFIVTTPQNLAFLFLLLAIIYGLSCKNIYDLTIIYLFAFAALVSQPIAGIPALLFALALTVYHSDVKTRRGASLRKYFYIIIFIISSLALPLAFYLFQDTPPLERGAGGLKGLITPLIRGAGGLNVPNQENFILNFIYLYGFNLKIIIAILAAVGMIMCYRHRDQCKVFNIYILMSASTFISFLLAKTLSFDFLIDYERNNYTDRIFIIAAFFLLPFIITALYAMINKILKQNNAIKLPFAIFFVLTITAGLYLSYPRIDNYFNSHGYSTGQNDIAAVRWIEENANGDYIVLANQNVSAAALREYGFKKYYNPPLLGKERPAYRTGRDGVRSESQIFYYPIPTGEILYQYYLDMVYKKPSRATMLAAMNLTGVNEGYFVLNKYWWAFSKILEEAKLEADGWEEFGEGEVFVFRYKK
jgi:hypothetical protein